MIHEKAISTLSLTTILQLARFASVSRYAHHHSAIHYTSLYSTYQFLTGLTSVIIASDAVTVRRQSPVIA
jgi:hypothetical protein